VKILLILLVVWAIAFIVRILMRSQKPATQIPSSKTDKLHKCAFCGVHCPEDETFRYKDNAFCSKEHLDQYFQYKDDKPE
jgi:Pyruvate/2-oxoacid:ferredoxin oxidoreductase delta subunit